MVIKRKIDRTGIVLPMDEHGNWILPRKRSHIRSHRSDLSDLRVYIPVGLDPRVPEDPPDPLEAEFEERLR